MLQVGAEVTWPGGSGVVDMVVTSGEVPGVEQRMTGTKSVPLARVRTPTGMRVAVPAVELDTTDSAEQLPPAVLGAVRARGLKSWPGVEATTLSRHEWADGRVKAFTDTAAGQRPAGYVRDDDLLAQVENI